jgi:hypothetical protein
VETWIRDHLARLGITAAGPADPARVKPWGTVQRLATDHGPVWFKATAPVLRHEVALTVRLAARHADLAPEVLAADPGRGWMLLADAG